jgi:hypothetical protein
MSDKPNNPDSSNRDYTLSGLSEKAPDTETPWHDWLAGLSGLSGRITASASRS